mgnify:CR=1 FL=1
MGTVVFFIIALLTVGAAWRVVTSKNIVHSALFLALTFAGIAALYVLLDADFLAAVQVLISMGAISIMIIFAIMLTLRGDVKQSNPAVKSWRWGIAGSVLLFGIIALVVLNHSDWNLLSAPWEGEGTAFDLSVLMLSEYVIPFEAAGFLLTVALIGAVILAKGAKEEK